MKILCTGGAGFIGSHLVKRLLKEKHQVVVIDDCSAGMMKNLPLKHKNLVIFGGSILNEGADFLYEGIDIVFHLAALTRPRESFIKPMETKRINVEGTLKVLLNAYACGVKKFIFMSSASAYGYQKLYPFDERYPLNPVSPYAISKQIGEQCCRLHEDSLMKVNCIRPFNVYGKGQSPDGQYAAAIPKFVEALKKGKKPFITGDGKQFRDFVHVEDVVDLMVKVSTSDLSGEVFNAGTGTHTTLNSLYETIRGIMKKNVEPKYVKEVKEPNTLAGMAKARKLLNWRLKNSLVEGLLKTI